MAKKKTARTGKNAADCLAFYVLERDENYPGDADAEVTIPGDEWAEIVALAKEIIGNKRPTEKKG